MCHEAGCKAAAVALSSPRIFLAEGCTAISRELGSLTDKIFRDTSVSVLKTMNLPSMELYDSPAERHRYVKQVRGLQIKRS